MMSHDLIALCQREETDERTLGDLFFYYGKALADIGIARALCWLTAQLIGIVSTYHEAQSVINQIMSEFMQKPLKSLADLFGSVA